MNNLNAERHDDVREVFRETPAISMRGTAVRRLGTLQEAEPRFEPRFCICLDSRLPAKTYRPASNSFE